MSQALQSQSIRVRRGTASGIHRSVMRVGDRMCDIECGEGAAREALTEHLRAAARAEHVHVRPVVDCWSEGETLFIARPLASSTLEQLLRGGRVLAPGAAVTLLAPLARAIGACHRAGVTGVRLLPDAIVLTNNGAPQLDGSELRCETDEPSPRWRRQSPGVASDVTEYLRLANSILHDTVPAFEQLVRAGDWRGVHQWLLDFAAPIPLLAASALVTQSTDAQRSHAAASTRRQIRIDRAPQLSDLITRAHEAVRSMKARVRPRFWFVALGGAAAAIIATVTILQPNTTGATAHTELASSSMPSSSPQPTGMQPEEPAASAAPVPVKEPIEAVESLLQQREECLAEAADECLRAILMEGSLLYADDMAGEPNWRMPDDAKLSLHQELGDAVIVEVVHEEQPASVLAVNTEAGWVLREIWTD